MSNYKQNKNGKMKKENKNGKTLFQPYKCKFIYSSSGRQQTQTLAFIYLFRLVYTAAATHSPHRPHSLCINIVWERCHTITSPSPHYTISNAADCMYESSNMEN